MASQDYNRPLMLARAQAWEGVDPDAAAPDAPDAPDAPAAPAAEHRAPRTEHRAPSTRYRAADDPRARIRRQRGRGRGRTLPFVDDAQNAPT